MAAKSYDNNFRVTEKGASKLIESFNANKTVKVIQKSEIVKIASRNDYDRLNKVLAAKNK